MRKLLALIILAAVAALVFVPMVGQADQPPDQNNAAFISKDFGCGMLDGDGGFVITTDGNHSVVTSSGHTTLICKAKGVANSTGRAVKYEGFGCGTFLGFTTDTQEIVSAAGNATLRCRI